MNGNDANPLFEIPLVLVGLVGIATLVTLTFRYSTHWNRLERLYLKKNAVIDHDIGYQYYLEIKTPLIPGIFNNFRLVIAIAANKTGLVLRALWPVRWLFRTIEVPWKEFTVGETETALLMPYEIIFSKVPEVQIRISRDAGEKLLALGALHSTLSVTPQT